MIKAVIFDVDGVLLDSFEANLKFFNDLLRKFGHTPPTREEYKGLMASHMKAIIKQFSKLESEDEIQKIWIVGRDKKEVPYPSHLLNLPDALEETIKILHKDFILGIVTSREGSGVYRIPQLASLKKYFKVIISFEDTNDHKPHPAPLLLAAQKLNIKPEECVYIGDTETDLKAARSAGMKAIIFSKEIFKDAHAQTVIFSKLPEIIKSIKS